MGTVCIARSVPSITPYPIPALIPCGVMCAIEVSMVLKPYAWISYLVISFSSGFDPGTVRPHYPHLRYPVPSPSTAVFLLEQIRNNPTAHYTTAPSFIQFPTFVHNFIQNGCVQICEVSLKTPLLS